MRIPLHYRDWGGTANGLFRFDGVCFAPWVDASGDKGPMSANVSARLAGRDRSLWTGEAFSIAREANANAFQHSGVSEINVVLTYGRFELPLSIAGNGVGIPEKFIRVARPAHRGLAGMRERAPTAWSVDLREHFDRWHSGLIEDENLHGVPETAPTIFVSLLRKKEREEDRD